METPLAAASTALLLMDYQPGILSGLKQPERLLQHAANAIEFVRARGGRIAYVRVAFTEADYASFPPYSLMGARVKAAGAALRDGSPQAQVHASVAPHAGDIVVRKTRVGAFSTTDLHRQLKAAGIETVVLAGVHTSGVTLSTVREAHDLDYRIVVLADACDDPDPQVHEVLVRKVFPKQATVASTEDFRKMLDI